MQGAQQQPVDPRAVVSSSSRGAPAAANAPQNNIVPVAGSSNALKLPPVVFPAYDGTPDKFLDWRTKLEMTVRLLTPGSCTTQQQIFLAANEFTGSAAAWWLDKFRSGDTDTWVGLEQLVAAMAAEFLPRDLMSRYRDQWLRLPMEKGPNGWYNITALEQRIRLLSHAIPGTTEEAKTHMFLSCLTTQNDIRKLVSLQHPNTLEVAAAIARDCQTAAQSSNGYRRKPPGPGRGQPPPPPPRNQHQYTGWGQQQYPGPTPMDLGGMATHRRPIVCDHCGEPGHIRPVCPKRAPPGGAGRGKSRATAPRGR